MKLTIEVDGKSYTIDRPASLEIMGLTSRALFCPFCASVWAILEIEDADRFIPDSVSCTFCANPSIFMAPVPGSLLDIQSRHRVDLELLDYLPHDLLIREFNLHLLYLMQEPINVSNSNTESSFQQQWDQCSEPAVLTGFASDVGPERLPGIDCAGDELSPQRG